MRLQAIEPVRGWTQTGKRAAVERHVSLAISANKVRDLNRVIHRRPAMRVHGNGIARRDARVEYSNSFVLENQCMVPGRRDHGIELIRPDPRCHGRVRYNMRGKAMVSRICSSPHIHATNRSTPMPNPACGTEPYLRRSRYHSKASRGRL